MHLALPDCPHPSLSSLSASPFSPPVSLFVGVHVFVRASRVTGDLDEEEEAGEGAEGQGMLPCIDDESMGLPPSAAATPRAGTLVSRLSAPGDIHGYTSVFHTAV